MLRKKIGQVSKEYGVPSSTLRYYDKIGLLKPAGLYENGYRYYERMQLLDLMMIIILRENSVAIDEIKSFLETKNLQSGYEILEQGIRKIESQIAKLTKSKDMIYNLLFSLDNIYKMPLMAPFIRSHEERHVLINRTSFGEGFEEMEKAFSKIENQFIKNPALSIIPIQIISKECFLNEQFNQFIGIFFQTTELMANETLSAGKYVVIHFTKNHTEATKGIMTFIKENNLEIDGDIYMASTAGFVLSSTKDEHQYIFEVPVKKKLVSE